jgi:hypothetical protein
MQWTDPAVIAAIIQSVGTLLAAIMAAFIAALLGKKFADRRRLELKLAIAQQDIAYLLKVEENHCNRNLEAGEPSSFKLRMRKAASDQGYAWSGKFTPGRARSFLQHSQLE